MEKPYNKRENIKSLKDNPVRINVPNNNNQNNISKIQEDTEMIEAEETIPNNIKEVKETDASVIAQPSITNNTEKLEEIDVSVITHPSINKPKRLATKEREEEIIQEMESNSTRNKQPRKEEKATTENQDLPSTRLKKKKEDARTTPTTPKKITLLHGKRRYDIADDLTKLTANISIAQLLDISPKLRSELTKALKLKSPELVEENPEKIMLSTLNRDDVATAECIVDNVKGVAFLDTCASINIITRSFLNKLKNVTPSGFSDDNIIQIFSSKNVIMETCNLRVQFGNVFIQDNFRIIDQDTQIFDILIGYRTLKENNLFINPIDNFLCRMNEDEEWYRIIPLHKYHSNDTNQNNTPNDDSQNDDSLLFCVITKYDDNNKKENTNQINTGTDLTSDDDEKENIIQEIIKGSPKNCRAKVNDLFQNFKPILATRIEELEPTKLLPHNITLVENAKPIKQKCYRLSKVQAKALKEEITKLLKNKLIVPSNSPWSFPVILVLKKNKKWRLCIDYRKLNNVTIKDAYALPVIDEILFSIGKSVKYFTTIDLFSGFHQIPMNEADIPKTSFTTMYGNYQFLVMPFGLCNAPATFQREMNRIFFPLIGVCMFVYIDNLVIFSNSFEEHIQDIIKVFTIIRDNGLKINFNKCHFFKQKVELLGHTISTHGVSPISAKIEVISNWLAPKNVKQLQSFLGAIGYYRKFIHNYASIAKPLYKLLKKGISFEWTSSQEESFQSLKDKLLSAPILNMPDFDKPFLIRTDASYAGIGGVLLQKDDNNVEKPIHYVSRSLKPEEVNYGITDLEGTAASYCVNKFKSYISGSKFDTILYTDHKPLVGLFKNKEPNNSRQTRWVILLSMLNVKVMYEPGKKNVVADALSRMESTNNKIVATLATDPSTINSTKDNSLLVKFKENFITINNEKYYMDKESQNLRKVVENNNSKIDLVLKAHRVGHEGVYKTYNRLKRDFYWTNMILDVKYIVSTCHRCQIFRPQRTNNQTEDIPTKPGLPFTKVGLDIVGPLPRSIKGNLYIIVLVDYLTKWVEAEATSKVESEDVISFLSKVFSRHGIPEVLVTDNGPQFRSEKTKSFLDLYGVYVHFTSTYHPESNGEV